MAGFYSYDFASNEDPISVTDGSKSSSFSSVFRIVFFALLGFTIAKILARGGSTGTSFYVDLGTLLQKFSNSPTIPTDWISYVNTNFGNTFPWGFQWLGEAIDFIVSIFSGIIFASIAGGNALIFVFYFLRWVLL